MGACAGESMIKLETKDPLPVARVIDLMNAFRRVNIEWLLTMHAKANRGVAGLGPRGGAKP